MKNIIYILFFLLVISCNKKDEIFEKSPTERTQQHILDLQEELVNSQYGWKMIYFSRTDSLLFTTPNKIINRQNSHFQTKLQNEGFGGFYYTLNFSKNGFVQMSADYNKQSLTKKKQGKYKIELNTYLQLSFLTYNYIHEIVNDQFKAASDFLYLGKDSVQNLIFTTVNYYETAREYIVLKKIATNNDSTNCLKESYENRVFFEDMLNPQLNISKGSQEFFHSNVYLKGNILNINEKFLQAIKNNRYYVFEYDATPEEEFYPRKKSSFLGSGYVGTETGISFHSGLRYSQKIIFYDFLREGNKFVAKHYDINGQPTGYTAEIYDKGI